MTRMSSARGFTLVEALVVLGIIAMLCMLLIPAQRGAREAARRNNCSNGMRQLCLGVLNLEHATQRFPLASYGSAIDKNGPVPMSDGDGHSAFVALLPYIGETKLFDDISAVSDQFQEPINSEKFLVGSGSGQQGSLWDEPVELLICPSFPGENNARAKYPGVSSPQVSNYQAMVAGCVEGSDQRVADSDPFVGGVLVTQATSPEGLKLGDLKSGTSSAILFAESRAEQWSGWFSGSSSMTVALPPDLVKREDLIADKTDLDFLTVPDGVPSGLNYGRRIDQKRTNTSMFWESKKDARDWGPSSAHNGDVVMHGYADGHVQALNAGIDATVYLRVVSRNFSRNDD